MTAYFQTELKYKLDQFLSAEKNRFPETDRLKIDLHCHDFNSDVPDELLGRILRVPETWLSSAQLLDTLKQHDCNAFTITNHNNARSCYEQQDKGIDVLTAAEFSCFVPDFEIGIHVLAYGFTPDQESKLNKLRRNVYDFQRYARKHDIPTIWAHPLYHYSVKQMPPQEFFNKMILLFERFETLNGQRDTWQNLLVHQWITQMGEDRIASYAKQFDIQPLDFCADPYRKVLTGGSDSHMGIFAGSTGSYLYVPNLAERLQTTAASDLALEAIRAGNIAPFGAHQNTEKLTVAFLDYACQIALNYKDPGLVRLMLHKGEMKDKTIAMLTSNAFSEIQNHKVTMSFIKLFHECMMGEKPSRFTKLLLPKHYKPVFDEAVKIAEVKQTKSGEELVNGFQQSVVAINDILNELLTSRLTKKIGDLKLDKKMEQQSIDSILEKLELPTSVRAYVDKEASKQGMDTSKFLDGLPFPFFASLFILAAHFTSAKTMFHTRPFLRKFSKNLGQLEHPKRILWLTDTFGDKNGVSMFLQEAHKEIKKRNLPIDIMTCSSTLESDEHLVVLKPISEFELPQYQGQSMRIPNFLEVHNRFQEGEYDRIICSTEGIMGLCGLYLKHAYTVEASFYMHTDWLMFAKKVLKLTQHNRDRVRRVLRFFYQSFDHVLVLNSDQKAWLSDVDMNLAPEKVHQTAHWVNECFAPQPKNKKELFGVGEDTPILLYVGRVSKEKGVLELPNIVARVQAVHENVRLVVVGKGPAQEQLKKDIPDGIFIDWIEQAKLPSIYSSADLLLLPSKFDTFCNVVLEALSCGLPVAAYNKKGPKDIIQDKVCGYLVKSPSEMATKATKFLDLDDAMPMRAAAIARSKSYNAGVILHDMLNAIGMNDE